MKAVHTLQELRPTNSRFCSLDASLRCNPPLTCAALPGAAHIKGSQIESCGPWPEVALKDTNKDKNSVLHT